MFLQNFDLVAIGVLDEDDSEVTQFLSYLMAALGKGTSTGFDPARDLVRVALINQTTMLASESRAIGRLFEDTMLARYGEAGLKEHFRDFDTICNATQENQERQKAEDALREAYDDLELRVEQRTAELLSFSPVRTTPESWLPAGPLTVGFTAGASTPDTKLAEVMHRLAALAGVNLDSALESD